MTPTVPAIPSLQTQNAATSSLSFSHHINLQQIQSQFSNAAANQELPFPIKKEHQNFTLRPPWLGPPPIDLTTPSSIFQEFQENHNNHHNPNPNPNPNTSSTGTGTSSSLQPFHQPPPHISATALLQKAAEMGSKSSNAHVPAGESTTTAGFGLKLASRDHFLNALSPFGNKAASPSMLHDIMINTSGFDHRPGSTFEDDDLSFAGMLNASSSPSKKPHDFDATLNHFTNHDDGMTRDFLGLRPLSQSDILSFAGLSNCINTTSCAEHQTQPHTSWQN